MKTIDRLIERAKDDHEILAVVLFGSAARGEHSRDSDVDVCLILNLSSYSPLSLSQKKLDYLTEAKVDIQIFQQLPIYIRTRVLKDGQVLFCRDEELLYKVAFRTIREFNDFEPFYRAYLREVADAG